MNKKNILYFLFFISLILLSVSVISATDINQNITNQDTSSFFESSEIGESNENVQSEIPKTVHIDSSNFDDYVTDGKFNDNVSDGDTIDIQGKLDSSKFALNVNKPVNIISSTNDAYLDFDTLCTNTQGGYKNGIFQVSRGGAGTNITGITFHNTRVYVIDTSDVYINNISSICEQAIGLGVGSFSIRGGSNNITVVNSYFMNYPNGGHSNFVVAGASNCLIENNTIQCDNTGGMTGNLLYLTTYYSNGFSNKNITIRSNTIRTIGPSLSTNYGLALEGSGHIIENNIIDNPFPVMAQYADADYDFETNIDSIIFNNNTIIRGLPQLVFPGIVSNNTFNEGVTLKQVYAYNNTFNTVTIQNNVKFENNTAKQVTITGDNNILNNNEIYSNEDYAVTITGENNTLSDNKIAGYLGRGENAISNSTEIISINNSEDINRVFYIDDENWEKYLTIKSKAYRTNSNFLKSNDIVILNITDDGVTSTFADFNLKKTDSLTVVSNGLAVQAYAKLTILNSRILVENAQTASNQEITLINSILARIQNQHVSINSSVLATKYFITTNNNYVLTEVAIRSNDETYSITDEGFLPLAPYSQLDVYRYTKIQRGSIFGNYKDNLYLNVPLIMNGVGDIPGLIDTNFSFIEGSEYTTVKNIVFNKSVIINAKNINFYNCTFNGDVEINNESVMMENNIFNGKISLYSSNKLIFNNNNVSYEELPFNIYNSNLMTIENNTIITTADNTIIFDDESNSNTVKNNILVANTLLGDDSVVDGDNIVEDNGASYNTSIEIVADESLFKNDVSNVTVTVYNLLNNTPVDKGYVEVYLDGILQGTKPLVNGQVTLEVNTEKSSLGTVPLKVWYYEGIRYANNVSSINVTVVKSNVSITVDEFTAKFNENATITATFLNQNGNPVKDSNVTFTVGRTSYTVETVDGVATLDELVTTEWLDAGRITVSFPATDDYNSNFTTVVLNTSKDDVIVTPVVSVEDGVASIQLNLADSLNNPVSDGKVTITTLDGKELASGRVSNGVYTTSVTLPEDYQEEYLAANYTGSYYYNDFSRNVKITQMLNSTITLETNSPLAGEELTITGTLTDSKNNPISDEEVTVNTDGTKTTYTTDENGAFTHTYTPVLGVNNITVTFNGNSDAYGTSAEKTITIRDTDRDMNDVLNQLEQLREENAKLQEQINNLTQQGITTQEQILALLDLINKQTEIINKQTELIANQTNAINNLTEQNENLTNKIDELTAPEETTLTINSINNVKYGDSVVISGLLSSQKGNSLSNQEILISINGAEPVSVSTVNGVFEYKNTFRSVGEQTVTVTYEGNDYYKESETSITFNVEKQDTTITLDNIENVAYGDNVTITGTLTDANGRVLTSTNVVVTVNGKSVKAKTDSTGVFTASVKTTTVGEQTVTVTYAGNARYAETEATATFTVDKQSVIITVDPISETGYGSNAIITGTVTDANGKALVNTNVKVSVNGKTYTAKTDSTGAFTASVLANAMGTVDVTVTYAGNTRYAQAETTATFTVVAQEVELTTTDAQLVDGTISITGTFKDANGKALTNSNVVVTVNGKRYNVKTDSTGAFTYTGETTESSVTFTLGYAGSARFNAITTDEQTLTQA